jgi:uncharacterized protein (TIGR02611 family)
MPSMIDVSLKKMKRLVVAVIGFTILVMGIAMIILPGPALVVIPLGLGILATEFVWARRMLDNVRERIRRSVNITKQPSDSP